MSESEQNKIPPSVSAWTRETFDKAVRQLIAGGLIDVEVIEARPFWTLEDQIVIGQVREANASVVFHWVICGAVPTDHIGSELAATPRDVARHLSLKWQLDADRPGIDPSEAERLRQSAELLYGLTERDDIWQ